MAANRRRGEIAAIIDGTERVLCLTPGRAGRARKRLRGRRPQRADGALRHGQALGAGHLQGSRRRPARRRHAGHRGRCAGHAAGRRRGGFRGDRRRAAEGDLRRPGGGGDGGPSSAASGTARRFPWDELIATGLGLLRLSPRDFWAMTPREIGHLLLALRGDQVAPPSRASLDTLMAQYPDRSRGRT